MEFRISIQSQIASRRVTDIASGLRRAINGLPGVTYTGQVINQAQTQTQAQTQAETQAQAQPQMPAQPPAHGWETLLVGLPPSKVSAVLNMVKSHTGNPELGPITVEIATAGLKASFEPQVLTHDQLKRLAGALAGP